MLITKVQKKHKNITSLKFRPTVTEKRKFREFVRKRGKVSLYPYFHHKVQNCENVSWLSGFFTLKFQLYGKNMV